jgi:hypothetical protein
MSPFINLILLTSVPDAPAIRGKAGEVVARPEFQLDVQADPESLNLWVRMLRWILTELRRLFAFMQSLPGPLWWAIVIGLCVVLIALITHIIWSFATSIRGKARRRFTADGDDLPDPEELERLAGRSELLGDYIGAVRYLFRASLLRIERSEEKPIRRGITNRELLSRYKTSPLFEPLKRFVATIDAKWYGHEECMAEDIQNCRMEYSRICGLVERQPHAVRA